MAVKLNSFKLPNSVILKMRDNIDQSRLKSVEFGFNLCEENGELHDENQCSGTECSIDILKGCSKGKHAGLFHSHPHMSSEPSIQDILNTYYVGIGCIGSTEEDVIKCYVRNDKNYTQEGLMTITAGLIRYESPLLLSQYSREDITKYKKWLKARSDLKKSYLHTVDVRI